MPPIKNPKSDREDFGFGLHLCDLWFGSSIKNPGHVYAVFRPPMASGGWGQSSQTHETDPPLLQISGYALYTKRVMLIDFQVLESYNEKLLS